MTSLHVISGLGPTQSKILATPMVYTQFLNCYLFSTCLLRRLSPLVFFFRLFRLVSDLKNYAAVADLRLWTKAFQRAIATCGLRKLKFGCGVANCCRLKKKVVVPISQH